MFKFNTSTKVFRNTISTATVALACGIMLMPTPAQAAEVDDIVAAWPVEARKSAEKTIMRHGQPDEMTPSMLIWNSNGPWHQIIATNEVTKHVFPAPHPDVLEGVIKYEVPENKFDELARFDGSINVDRTRGLMSARCDSDEHNMLALNLAHDIITGKRSVEGARAFYGRAIMLEKGKKQLHPYLFKFMFDTDRANTNDPDMQTIKMP